MLGSRKDADEPAKHQLKPALRFRRRQIRYRPLFPDDVPQFGHEIDNKQPIWFQRVPKRITPGAQFVFASAEKLSDKALECLGQRRVRDVSLVLVELAGCKQAPRRNERLVELIDDGGLADARVPGDQHELRPPARDDAVKGGEQGLDLTFATV